MRIKWLPGLSTIPDCLMSNLTGQVTCFILGPPPHVSPELIRKAISKRKPGKAAGPSGIVAEMIKAFDETGLELVRKLTESIIVNGDIPSEWHSNFIKAKVLLSTGETFVFSNLKTKS